MADRVNPQAEASISPDRGDDRIGVLVQLKGHRTWMSREDARALVHVTEKALATADRLVRKRSVS